ncbi:(d)CMP kinase [Sneathia sanguinegens]|uniref:Cytidylate kinase n=1 Tax=Sneathia sanguinegens TaxID=40543 RepID=A0ABT7HKF6_9FUSO|nr:(d)CMP kinase [Sneathia sanguinegens]MDK9580110.1 (d)CMP kinase [Sneathia sanguinegens]
MIIAVDGPSGSGKSTISKKIAEILGISYIDTGAMYRILALYLKENNLEFRKEILKNINIKQEKNIFYLNGRDVSKLIRENDIAKKASDISKLKEVREYMVEEQRKLGKEKSIILDGRDITTVVFPNADYKFYLTASLEQRAKRRYLENNKVNFEVLLEDMKKRDYQDSTRENSPLKIAKDAIIIDTTNMTEKEVVNKMLDIIKGEANAL